MVKIHFSNKLLFTGKKLFKKPTFKKPASLEGDSSVG